MLKMIVLDNTGDTVLEFDMSVADEAKFAAEQFNKFVHDGMQVIGKDESGNLSMSYQFNPQAVEYVVGLPLVGG